MLRRLEKFRKHTEKLSGKWTLSVLLFLYNRPQKFNKIKLLFSTISSKVLSETIDNLEKQGLIHKDAHGKYHCTLAGIKLARQLLLLMTTLEEIF